MAGSLYLGSNKVCPAIVVKSGYDVKNAYFTENVFTSVDSNGKLTASTTEQGDLVFTGFKDVGDNVLEEKFYEDSTITNGVVFNDLEQISGEEACISMFDTCQNIKSASFPKLKVVSGDYACAGMFIYCIGLSSVSFPELTTISGVRSFMGIFTATPLKSISFPKLSIISGYNTIGSAFRGCKELEDIYFPALTTTSFGSDLNQFLWLFDGHTAETSGNVTIHFPSNLQSTIAELEGYPTFSGNYTTLAFDLPATS